MTDAIVSTLGIQVQKINSDQTPAIEVSTLGIQVQKINSDQTPAIEVSTLGIQVQKINSDQTPAIEVTTLSVQVMVKEPVSVISISAQETGGDTAHIEITTETAISIAAKEDGQDTASILIHVEPEPEVIEECPVEPYLDLITMEHRDKLNFVSTVSEVCRPFVDIRCQIGKFPASYDVDTAVGAQLDVVGQWVGITRFLEVPLTDVYFSFDIEGLGFDQGVWFGPYDAETGLVRLPDDYYRLLIKMKILNNQWNGSKENAYEIINAIFAPYGYFFFIEDHGDLSITIGLIGAEPPTPLLIALLTAGKFDIKPAGVRIRAYVYQSQAGPVFAFDLNTALFAGFDTGAWATLVTPT